MEFRASNMLCGFGSQIVLCAQPLSAHGLCSLQCPHHLLCSFSKRFGGVLTIQGIT